METTEGNDTGYKMRPGCMRIQVRTDHAVRFQSVIMIPGPRISRGSVGSWLILVIAFVVAFAASLGVKWQLSRQTSTIQRVAVVESTADQGETGSHALASSENDRFASERFNRGNDGTRLIHSVNVEEFAQDGTTQGRKNRGESHDEWLQQLYTRLYSLESPAAGTEETSPVIAGRVLTPGRQPVPGVEVRAQLRQYFKTAGDEASARQSGALRTTTDNNGFYAFGDLSEGIYMISTQPSGRYGPARLEVHTGVKYADLVPGLMEGATVSGVVTDTMGTELEGVRIMPLVKGIPDGAVSDTDGKFKFTVMLQGDTSSFPVRFQREGYREQRYRVSENDWTEDGSIVFTVEMEPVYAFGSVSGSLRNSVGVQIAGETVWLYSPSLKSKYSAVSDAGGEYLFSKVEVADDYQLRVTPAGPYHSFSEHGLQLNQGNLRKDIELELLNRRYQLSGRIVDQGGHPVPNLTLTLRSQSDSGHRLAVASDANGEFVVENVPEGELVIESRTMPYYTLTGLRLSGNEKEHSVDLVIDRGQQKLLGQVLNNDGNPIPASRISIASSQLINGMRTWLSSNTGTDAKGRFVFTDLGTGKYTVRVNAPGYESVRIQPVVGTQNELVVRLAKNPI